MTNQLDVLRTVTTVVADTGDIEEIQKYHPEDATTNPTLILKAAKLSKYKNLLEDAVNYAKSLSDDKHTQILEAEDKLAVNIGREILNFIPGRISTEVDARLSFDTKGSIEKAKKLIKLYELAGVKKERVLIKLAATWEGIKAAEALEKEGINCNLTLLFSFAQARACCEAKVFLISPFVGRILDWHKAKTSLTYESSEDPGVISVSSIYKYYKSHGYNTVVMGASFRNTGQIIELAGCDRLTISPQLLEELSNSSDHFEQKLINDFVALTAPKIMSESEFRWQHNQDAMATEKLAEGIRNFAIDQESLGEMLSTYFNTP
ncbi:MAG: transaldolase [Paraglaciecola sp.]|uniref:transaldolase n=1 Tax=Paraglaciecola sp. TaxID=1920173 RepID=UPI00273FF9FA|nr:transaldolase [Paraglaciecola sp.]MDP5030553.1 transaldolase [Paraglaciecola sp.]MDP5131562.1 transaldolase [Paraglaciecola sp.]